MEISIKNLWESYNTIENFYTVVEGNFNAIMMSVNDKNINYNIELHKIYERFDGNDWITAHRRADDYCIENQYSGFAQDFLNEIYKKFNLTSEDLDIVYENGNRKWIYGDKARKYINKIDNFYAKWIVNEWYTLCDALILKNSKGEYKYIILKYYFKRGTMDNEDYKVYYEGGNYTIIKKRL
jgi:hypothetical protein